MRIAITGKGGSGKTTLAATLARVLAERGYVVNALDGDPNANLAAALGLAADDRARLRPLPGGIVEERQEKGQAASLHLTRPFNEVIAEYGAVGPHGVRTLSMTGLLGAGKGCICGQHSMVRGLIAGIGAAAGEVTILDMEASIEHLSRGTMRHVDTLLVVAEPYYRALETLKRIVPLGRELGIPSVAAVGNKVRSPGDDEAIHQFCRRVGVEVLASVPFDEAVQEADRRNVPLVDHDRASPAAIAIGELAEAIVGGVQAGFVVGQPRAAARPADTVGPAGS